MTCDWMEQRPKKDTKIEGKRQKWRCNSLSRLVIDAFLVDRWVSGTRAVTTKMGLYIVRSNSLLGVIAV